MGDSLQQYRSRIGSFDLSRNKLVGNIKFRGGNMNRRMKSNLKPGIRTLVILALCLAPICFLISGLGRNLHPQVPQYLGTLTITSKGCHSSESFREQLNNNGGGPWSVDVNFAARYTYGNRRTGIKLAHWNKGGGYLCNKINEVENLVRDYKPHVLGISESNFKIEHDKGDVKIEDYDIYLAKTIENQNLNISRVAVYVQKDVIVKVRHDLMDDSFSSIWLELGLPRQKKILVCNVYREWQYLGQEDNTSLSVNAQLSRWLTFIEQWGKAISEEREIHCLGDFNINSLNWNSPNTARLKPLITELYDRIIPHGFAQLVTVATRTWRGQEPSCIDHYYCNHPDKVSNIRAYYTGASDHKIIIATRFTKAEVVKPKFVRKRSYKNFDPEKFMAEVKKISWIDVYLCENVELAVQLITNKLSSILDIMAPVKIIQVRKKYAPWISEPTKEKINLRNIAQKKASESKSSSDWKDFRKVRNQVNSRGGSYSQNVYFLKSYPS